MAVNSSSNPTLMASLAKLPVPDLHDTVARFAEAARPLFSADEFETCLAKLNDFVATQGPTLQARLHQRSAEHANWLEDWWNEYAYFLNRSSVCFNVNYFFGFRDTPQPMAQARLAAALIDSAVRFRSQLESDGLELDNIRGKPMCMYQYQYMFATCRHPGEQRDWTEVYPRSESTHIAVAHKGRYFVLRVPAASTNRHADIAQIERLGSMRPQTRLKPQDLPYRSPCDLHNTADKGSMCQSYRMPIRMLKILSGQLQIIIDTTAQLERGKSIGVLTAALRDDWYAARECLLQVSSDNAASLRVLESSAFLVSLESVAPVTHKEFSLACHCSDGTDRYFDKNFQILVFANGRYGFNGEHSLTDATTDMRLCNVLVHDVETVAAEAQVTTAGDVAEGAPATFEELHFDYNDELLGHIQRAIEYFDATVAAHELSTLVFDSFGKEQIKKMKVSPDAFVQMAMQLAYYRQFRHVPATYESASTKAFARGRTETSRSVSAHSAAWCKAMVDHPETTGLHAKAELLRQSIANQSQFTAQCAKGSGIDRHLLGLEFALQEGEERHALFEDQVFTGSRHWKLSTSQISDPILAAYGWGEVVDDGFGVAYRIENNALHFNVVSQRMGSARLCQYLADALMDMRFLLTNAHKQPHEIMAEVDAVANVLTSIKLLSSSSSQPTTPTETPAPQPESRFRGPFAETPVAHAMVDGLDRLPSNEVICALEARLSRFVKESLSWALPSTS